MFGFFYSVKNAIVNSVSQPSSSSNRNTQQYSLLAELASDTAADLSPGVLIPTKIYQGAMSLKTIFSNDTHYHERMLHVIQAGIVTLQFGLSMYLFLNDDESCEDTSVTLCRYLTGLQYIYRGLVMTGSLAASLNPPVEPLPTSKSL